MGRRVLFCRDFGRLVRWYGLLSNVLFCPLLGAFSAIYAALQYAGAIGQGQTFINVENHRLFLIASDGDCPELRESIVAKLGVTLNGDLVFLNFFSLACNAHQCLDRIYTELVHLVAHCLLVFLPGARFSSERHHNHLIIR